MWHCRTRRGSGMHHQRGKIKIGKKMGPFMCLLGSCWCHRGAIQFRQSPNSKEKRKQKESTKNYML